MKYAINHPLKFRNAHKENGRLNYGSIIPPFFLGFAQTFIGFNVELVVILYLASLTNLMDIVIKFIALSAIARFDDIYAANLRDNKIKKATGKKLVIEFRRYMIFANHEDDDEYQREDS
jgi:hypothetical protein